MSTVSASEKQVRMGARLYEMRDAARRLLGESYAEKMAEVGLALKTVAEKTNRQPMSVAIEAARDANGLTQCYLLAAAVELAEPGQPGAAAGGQVGKPG